MTTATIELNDTGIRVSVAGNILGATPGYAVITRDTLSMGAAARKQARIHPLQTNNQFWRQLSLDPLDSDNPRVRHHADLAYNQLTEIHQRSDFDEVVFAVPGHFGNEQLSLLLGIAQECPFKTVALIDAAVAAIAPYAPRGRYIHLDTQLHQSVATLIEVDEQVVRQSVDVVAGAGLLACYDQWAKLISDNFIRQTRFDPFHDAAIEQRLYNQLPTWIEQSRHSGDATLQLEDKSINLPLTAWVDQAQALYAKIDQVVRRLTPAFDGIFLSDRAAMLPGLSQLWTQAQVLPPEAVPGSCHIHRQSLRGEPGSLGFTTRLPATSSPNVQVNTTRSTRPAVAIPTHILWRHRAYPLQPGRLFVATHKRDLQNEPTFSRQLSNASFCAIEAPDKADGARLRLFNGDAALLNGRPAAEGARLKTGDRLKFVHCDAELELISVMNEL